MRAGVWPELRAATLPRAAGCPRQRHQAAAEAAVGSKLPRRSRSAHALVHLRTHAFVRVHACQRCCVWERAAWLPLPSTPGRSPCGPAPSATGHAPRRPPPPLRHQRGRCRRRRHCRAVCAVGAPTPPPPLPPPRWYRGRTCGRQRTPLAAAAATAAPERFRIGRHPLLPPRASHLDAGVAAEPAACHGWRLTAATPAPSSHPPALQCRHA
eukprot:353500-Chlamydomonas_euryale.AAC.10